MSDTTGKTALGLDENVAAALSYAMGWITGVFFLFREPDNRFVQFHALQSTIVFGALSVASMIALSVPFLGWLVWLFLLLPVSAFLWLLLMFKAYQGELFKLPIAGEVAEQRSSQP